VFLCEAAYSKTLSALNKRLASWASSWSLLRSALVRDCGLRPEWPVQPWLFVPHDLQKPLKQKIFNILNIGDGPGQMPDPKTTDLEEVTPWKYPSWNRHDKPQGSDDQVMA
jgi:hypothetical protein